MAARRDAAAAAFDASAARYVARVLRARSLSLVSRVATATDHVLTTFSSAGGANAPRFRFGSAASQDRLLGARQVAAEVAGHVRLPGTDRDCDRAPAVEALRGEPCDGSLEE